MKQVVFISGPYRGNVEHNIIMARRAAIKLWQQGYAVICPHMNSARMDGECPDDYFLEGDLEILKRCDIIYILKNWEESEGASAELSLAKEIGLEVVYE
jgi:hypothetical protein